MFAGISGRVPALYLILKEGEGNGLYSNAENAGESIYKF